MTTKANPRRWNNAAKGERAIPVDDYTKPPEERLSYLPPYKNSVMGEYLLKYHPDEFCVSPIGHVLRVVPKEETEYNDPSTTF